MKQNQQNNANGKKQINQIVKILNPFFSVDQEYNCRFL